MMTPLRFNDLFGVSVFPPVSSCQNSPSRFFYSQDLVKTIPDTSPVFRRDIGLWKRLRLGEDSETPVSKGGVLAQCVKSNYVPTRSKTSSSGLEEHRYKSPSKNYLTSSSRPIHFAPFSPRLYGFYDVDHEYGSQVKSSPITSTRQSIDLDIDEAFLSSENDSYERKVVLNHILNDESMNNYMKNKQSTLYDTSINIIQSDASWKNDTLESMEEVNYRESPELIYSKESQEKYRVSGQVSYRVSQEINYRESPESQEGFEDMCETMEFSSSLIIDDSNSDISFKRCVRVEKTIPSKKPIQSVTKSSIRPKRKYVRKPKLVITLPVSLPDISFSGRPLKEENCVNLFENPRNTRRNRQPESIVFAPEKKRRLGPRSKTGCWTCRVRHKACPEERPHCSQCERLGLFCDYSSTRPEYMSDSSAQANKLREIKSFTSQHKKIHKQVFNK
jgi:hypothetical protein